MTVKIQVRRDLSSRWTSVNPVLTAGEFGYETDTGSLKIGNGSTVWADLPYANVPLKTYTPTFSQGASTNISKTVDWAKYSRSSGIITGNVALTASGAGTAGSAILINTPVTAPTTDLVVGSGFYRDSSTGIQYQAVAYLATTTKIALYSTHDVASTSTDSAIGVNPNIAVASGDIISIQFSYGVSL